MRIHLCERLVLEINYRILPFSCSFIYFTPNVVLGIGYHFTLGMGEYGGKHIRDNIGS